AEYPQTCTYSAAPWQNCDTRHGRRDSVPLRLPRSATAALTLGLVSASVLAGSLPAAASPAAGQGQSASPGAVRQREWWRPKRGVPRAWGVSRGAGVTVAVLSDGVAATTSDLAGSVMTGPDFTHSGLKSGDEFYGVLGTAAASLIAGHGHGPGGSQGIIGI